MSDVEESVEGIEAGADAVVVFWRPGCGFCMRLLRTLERSGVRVELHNIWEDDDARRFVAEHNRGNEIVPTVVVGELVSTNPDPGEFTRWLGEHHPELIDADVGAEAPAAGWRDRLRRS